MIPTSRIYLSVKGKKGNTTANKIPVMANCFPLPKKKLETLELNLLTTLTLLALWLFKLIKNLPITQDITSRNVNPH